MRRLAFPFALLLAGCVSQGPFPSLAPRPGEQLAIEEPAREAPVVADDESVSAFLAARLAETQLGARAFDGLHAEAERIVARAGPDGSDSWIEAQQAISRLTVARMRTAETVANLHWLSLERAQQPTSESDLRAINAAIADVEQIAASQQARIDRLRGLSER